MRTKGAAISFLMLALVAGGGGWVTAQDQPLVPEPEPFDNDIYSSADEAKQKDWCAPERACPCAYGYIEGLFLERSNCSADQPVIVQTIDDIPVATFLSTSDFDFDGEPAVRVVVGHQLHNGWAIEGAYFGLCDADTSLFLASPDEFTNLTFPGGLGFTNVFADIDNLWVDYSSSLHSGEVNMVCCCGCCETVGKGKDDCGQKGGCNTCCRTFEWFFGFRYLNFAEHLRFVADREEVGGVEQYGIYDLKTSNNLYGPQIGARVRRWGKKLGWEATGKAAVLGNSAQQEQYAYDYFDDFEIRPYASAVGGQVAFLGECNITGIYRLNQVWNLRAGYNVMWIGGVALAPDQLDFSGEIPSGYGLDSGGSVLLHGISLGVEARW